MSLDLPGFADPVADAQSTFRAVLDAVAHPGRTLALRTALQPPAPLCPAAAALLLTLVDADTPLWLAPAFAAARDWVGFHCGATVAADIGRAAFALATTLPPLTACYAGSDAAPQDSATLILQVAALGIGAGWRLAGPGLRAPSLLRVTGLPTDFAAIWSENGGNYPRGVDLLLCAGDRLAALPRSVAVVAA